MFVSAAMSGCCQRGVSTYIEYDLDFNIQAEALYEAEVEGAAVLGGPDAPVCWEATRFFFSASAAHAMGRGMD